MLIVCPFNLYYFKMIVQILDSYTGLKITLNHISIHCSLWANIDNLFTADTEEQ